MGHAANRIGRQGNASEGPCGLPPDRHKLANVKDGHVRMALRLQLALRVASVVEWVDDLPGVVD